MTGRRYRVNTHQTAGGKWQIDCTVENIKDTITHEGPANDKGDTTTKSIAQEQLDLVNEVIKRYRANGKPMAGDKP